MTSNTPRWGLVTAEPHEHLVHVRRGRVLRSHQGGSCFLWPGDAVARVDTSVRRLQFKADQVTREKVGVGVTGFAVFRIVQPLLAWQTLDLSDGNGYTTILQQMFVGATRRLVANLSLDECMTRRKDALAQELLAEVAPVVEGRGRAEDTTTRGWGIAIDTIEIQDVRVLSEEVFRNLQAPYREELELEALRARGEVQAEHRRLDVTAVREQELARQAQMELEQARLAAERDRDRQRVAHDAELESQRLEARILRERQEGDASVIIAELHARRERLEGEVRAEILRLERAAVDAVSAERLQELALIETLPRVAEAFRGSFETVHVSGGDLSFLSAGLSQVLQTLRLHGIDLPGPDS